MLDGLSILKAWSSRASHSSFSTALWQLYCCKTMAKGNGDSIIRLLGLSLTMSFVYLGLRECRLLSCWGFW